MTANVRAAGDTDRGGRPAAVRGGAASAGELIGWVAVVGVVAMAGLRCIVAMNPDLYWATDPRQGMALPEIGPLGAAVLDWLAMLTLALAVTAAVLRGQRVRWLLIGLWAIGLGFALWHGWDHAENLRLGGHWAGALALGVAAAHLAADDRWRRLMLAGLVAMAIPIGLQAMYGVVVEHPMTVADYEANREAILDSRGWEEGSVEQRKFEERLYQVQALGRFSLGNVLGTVMLTLALAAAGALAGLIGTGRWRRTLGWTIATAGVAALAGAVAVLTFSKGVILAGIVGVGAAAVACGMSWWLGRRDEESMGTHPRSGWASGSGGSWVGRGWAVVLLAVVVACVGAVVVRGMIGEPETIEGERSLLFRWHYWQAAASMWAERPITGVGPGRFQEAYLVHKNPLNPEDVRDPHNVFAAYVAGLGLGGIAWAAALIGLLWHAGRSLGARAMAAAGDGAEPAEERSDERAKRWMAVAAIAALAFCAQYWIELPRYWLAPALLWLAATAGWVAMAGWLSGRGEWNTRLGCVGLFGAVAAMMAHVQIEMSLTNMMAAPLLLAVLGAAAGGGGQSGNAAGEDAGATAGDRSRWLGGAAAGAVVVAAAVVTLAVGVVPIARQQATLGEAARQLANNRVPVAAQTLAEARQQRLGDGRIAHNEARLHAELAERAHARGDAVARNRHLAAAIRALQDGREHGELARLWRFEAGLSRRAWQLTGDERWLTHAVEAAEHVLEHDPYSIDAHVRAADLAWQLGEEQDEARERARQWYREALRLHELAYLDELRQLQRDDLARVRERAER